VVKTQAFLHANAQCGWSVRAIAVPLLDDFTGQKVGVDVRVNERDRQVVEVDFHGLQ